MANQQDTLNFVSLISNAEKQDEIVVLLEAAIYRYNAEQVFGDKSMSNPDNFAEMATHLVTRYDPDYYLFNDAAMFAQVLIAACLRCKQLKK